MKLIVNVSKDWKIGCDGDLLFKIPEDMKFFRNATEGKVVVMGRKTLLSFPNSKPLKNRVNIVLTQNKDFKAEGCILCNSYEELFEELKKYDDNDIFIIGGGKVYNDLYEYCQEAIITKVDACVDADTYLHNFDEDNNWEQIYESKEYIYQCLKFTFTTYKNKKIKIFG